MCCSTAQLLIEAAGGQFRQRTITEVFMPFKIAHLNEKSMCPRCGDTEDPCCNHGYCEALEGERNVGMCVHCGAELIERNGAWFHHSQFDQPFLGMPQDYV
jgi:hypothetical protein